MEYGKSFLTDNAGLTEFFNFKGGYNTQYGGGLQTFFKPFTTNVTGNGVAHYHKTLRGTGIDADASGLNPIGRYTLNENILHGYTMPGDLYLDPIDANNARLHGFKTPTTLVGPGYDVWGYPTPNYRPMWDISGSLSASVPSTGFYATGGSLALHLRDVPSPLWKAGPLDVRWDQERGVWAAPIGVFPAVITRVVASGITNPATGYFWAEHVKYDAKILDGIANPISVTGLNHIGPTPESGTYKVQPHGSGDFCFMVRYENNGSPQYGLWLMELPGINECVDQSVAVSLLSTIPTYPGSIGGDPMESSGYMVGSGLANGLETFPLDLTYGGIGFNTVSQYQIPIGTTGNTFEKKQILGVSGINISYNATGIVISMATGLGVYAMAGTNTDITTISGLTTPLSVQQGGTNSTTKVWVDLSTAQNVSGSKWFGNQIRFGEGSNTNIAIAYGKLTTIGMYVDVSGRGLMQAYLGTGYFSVNNTGARSWGKFLAKNEIDAVAPAIQVRETAGSVTYPLVIEDANGTGFLYLGTTGIQFGKNGNSTRLKNTTGVIGDHSLTMPTGGLLPNTIFVYSHLVGPERLSGVVDGVNLTFYTRYSVYNTGVLMVFENGILQGQGSGEDFVLTNGTGIIFNSGTPPASGSILKAMYQRVL